MWLSTTTGRHKGDKHPTENVVTKEEEEEEERQVITRVDLI